MLLSHPDKVGKSKENEQRYIDLNFALEVLTDPEKKEEYNQLLEFGTYYSLLYSPHYINIQFYSYAII